MTDAEPLPPPDSATRRAVLKAAVGAGVGLAAWSAPKIGTIPAYALTNSSGIFDSQCYSFSWFEGISGLLDAWQSGNGPGAPDDQTGGATNRTYTWNNVFGTDPLTVNANGNPRSGIATITMLGAPAGCEMVLQGTGVYSTGGYNTTATGCSPTGTLRTGNVNLSGTGGTVSGIPNGPFFGADNIIIFNVVCS